MRIKSLIALAAAAALTLTGCAAGAGQPAASNNTAGGSTPAASNRTITIGVVGSSQPQWELYTQKAKEQGLNVELKNFTDYTTENPAVSNGSLVANQFQHILYLARYNKDNNGDLVPVASTAIYPLALYSSKFKSVEEIPAGEQIAVPNDETNKSRALHVLAEAGLVKLKDGTGVIAGEEDIDAANSKVTVAPMDAQQTVTALPSIAGAVVNNDFVSDAGLNPADALFSDDADSEAAEPYINIFVVRKGDAEDPEVLKAARLLHDPEIVEALKKDSGDSAVIVDKTPAELQEILDKVSSDLVKG